MDLHIVPNYERPFSVQDLGFRGAATVMVRD